MNDTVRIRPAKAADARAIADLNVIADEGLPLIHWNKCAPAGIASTEHGAALAALPGTSTGFANTDLAGRDGDILGAACSYAIDPQSDGPEYMAPFRRFKSRFAGGWYLDFIAVRPDARGKGIASRLLDAAAERGARADTLFLLMLDTNAAAHRAYLRAGLCVAARESLQRDRPWPPPEAQEVLAYTRKIRR